MKIQFLWEKSLNYGLIFLYWPTSAAVFGTRLSSTTLVTSNQPMGIVIIGLSTPLDSICIPPSLLVGKKGGCIIIDSTRKGKRFPDSMSKTIPIWTCVLNRCINNHRKRMCGTASMADGAPCTSEAITENTEDVYLNWDCSLHLPLWVSETERASIEVRLEEWTRELEASGADIASLAICLKKPLRPLWISQKTVIWLNEVPDHDSWDFTPIILVSASSSSSILQQKTSSEFSWNYIPGAGDDEESWSRGLMPNLFWRNVYDLINLGPDMCNQKVADMVEKDRVCRAYRGQDAPQITMKGPKSVVIGGHCPGDEKQPLNSAIIIDDNSNHDGCMISWLGSTNVAVGTTQHATRAPEVDCILNCDKELLTIDPTYTYLHLPIVSSKFNRFSLLNCLSSAVNFAVSNLRKGKTLLVCCRDGEDISVCVCLGILVSLFNEGGIFDDGRSFSETVITKWEMRRRLVFVCKFATSARPSRGNLKQVFSFLSGGRAPVS